MRFIAVFCILNIHHIEHTACKASKVFSFRDEHLHVSESQCSLRPSTKASALVWANSARCQSSRCSSVSRGVLPYFSHTCLILLAGSDDEAHALL